MDEKIVENGSYYRSLARKIVLAIVIVSVIPLALASGTIRYYFQVAYQEKVLDHLKVLIKKHRQNIDTYLTEKLTDIRVEARSATFEELNSENFLNNRLKLLQDEHGKAFVDLGVVDDRGIQIAYAGPFKLKQADYSKAKWFEEAMRGDDYISDVFPGLRGHPHFIVAVRQEHQGKKWLFRATVDFDAFNSLVQNIRIGKTGFAFILNKKGELQTKALYEIAASAEHLAELMATQDKVVDEVSVTEAQDRNGTELIYVMSKLKNGEWLLAFQQEPSDAFAALYAARTVTVLIFLVGLIGIVVVALMLSKRMVKHIAEADQEKQMMNERVIEAGRLASIGELAAGIAHEINNPVAVMVEEAGWMQDLLEEDGLGKSESLDEFKRALNQIRSQGARCKQITHKLLSFARKTDPGPGT